MLNETLTCRRRVARRGYTVCQAVGGPRRSGLHREIRTDRGGARSSRRSPPSEAPNIAPERVEALVTRRECSVAATCEGFRLLPGLFHYQQQRSQTVSVRRLLARAAYRRDANVRAQAQGTRDGSGRVEPRWGRFGCLLWCNLWRPRWNIINYLEHNNQRKARTRALFAPLALSSPRLTRRYKQCGERTPTISAGERDSTASSSHSGPNCPSSQACVEYAPTRQAHTTSDPPSERRRR